MAGCLNSSDKSCFYNDNNNNHNVAWYIWGRWLLLGLILMAAVLAVLAFS